jgi:hypothetical protein
VPLFQHGRLPIHGPLSVRPLSGLATGGFVGAVFGALSLLPASAIPASGRFIGWLLVGAILGFVSGLFAPAFRYRVMATVVVWLGLSIALVAAAPYWQLAAWLALPEGAILFALFGAIVYGFLGWEYIDSPHQPPMPARATWREIRRALLRKLRWPSRPAR